MKKLVRGAALTTVVSAFILSLVSPISHLNSSAVLASPTIFSDTHDNSVSFPQTFSQRLGLSNFPEDQLIAHRASSAIQRHRPHGGHGGVGSPGTDPGVTTLQVYNPSNPPIHVWIRVPLTGQEGPLLISQMRATSASDGTNYPITALQTGNPNDPPKTGFFSLPQGATANISATTGPALVGILLSFLIGHQCPCGHGLVPPNCQGDRIYEQGPDQPNGVTAAEVTLNVSGNTDAKTESADISCVNGANAIIRIDYDKGQGNPFNNGEGGNADVKNAQNKEIDLAHRIDNNCGVKGVFPYNATDCIKAVNPVPCGDFKPICLQPVRQCQVQRDPKPGSARFGGTVKVTFISPASPH